MHADCKGALDAIDTSYRSFMHRQSYMSKQQVKAVLEYAISKGYKHTGQLTDEEVDKIINETK